ncbi:MAG: methyltransferase domain-containing protein [Proteobacteria bacterium]|nr:methyltransferase domain-containing protein [Pseudomonadota bacterium]MBI3496334.1 methyltransferase domain-containing protein [Pseudomonadota bacterium]
MSALAFDHSAGIGPPAPGKIPFRTKLKAWWNGYDPLDLCPRPTPPPAITMAPAAPPAALANDATESAAAKVRVWTASRIHVVERLWGDGFHTPGGGDHILELVKPMALNETMTLLDLGCGLGGGARTIAKTFNTWVTGIEWWKELAVAGVERSTKAGMEKKAAVQFHAGDRLTLKPKSFNAIYSKEALFTVPDKANLLEVIAGALRPGGQLCFTDYVLPTNEDPSPRIVEWQDRELAGATPWSVEGYAIALQALGLDLRIAEDMSERHRTLIREGWDQLQIATEGIVISQETMPILIREAEIWARRMALLRKGELKHYRFFAIKPGS